MTVDGDDVDLLMGLVQQRPDFSGLIEQFEEPERGKAHEDEKWFYVEFYGDGERWQQMCELLTPHLKGHSKHELEGGFFFEMVKAHLGGD